MKEFFPVLHTAALFSGISDEELAAMLSCLGARIDTFPKGSHLLRAGDAVDEVGLVLAGSALIVQEDIWGIISAWSAAGCLWSLEKCGMRACSTFTKAISFSKRRRLTVPFLLRVKEPPLGVLASADNPVSHGASGFCRWKKQLRSVEIGRTASARTI